MRTQHFELDARGYLPAATDVVAVLREGDEAALHSVWNTFHYRRILVDTLARIGSGEIDPADYEGDVEAYTRFELAQLAEVSALQALRANGRLVGLLTGRRWSVMQFAREAGASWSAIGEALEMTKQAAIDWYRRKMDGQAMYESEAHDTAQARAVLNEIDLRIPNKFDLRTL